jgi:hypothetical protein
MQEQTEFRVSFEFREKINTCPLIWGCPDANALNKKSFASIARLDIDLPLMCVDSLKCVALC